jgi:tRNA pseudouridine55 synthase
VTREAAYDAAPHGVLVVDKPRGPTSHDIVARVRRALGTRAVGHAGTLDPMATGALIVLVGEAAKLSAYLTADAKRYEATLRLGTETHTLDAEGDAVATAPVPRLTRAQVEAALAQFVGTQMQRAPVVSAIKQDGVALHARVRRGEDVEAPLREVVLHEAVLTHFDDARDRTPPDRSVSSPADDADAKPASLLEGSATELTLRLHTGKGFYVRSLGRDLAHALGTVGHLSALRRTASGLFGVGALAVTPVVEGALLEAAARGDAVARAEVRAALIPLERACDALPGVVLSDDGVRVARMGQPLVAASFAAGLPTVDDAEQVLVARASDGAPVALIRRAEDGGFRVARGFVAQPIVTPGTT